MHWSHGAGKIIYDELRDVSSKILRSIDCFTEPHRIDGIGYTRTRPWKKDEYGMHAYKGILFHFTGGVSDINLLRWANHPSYGNKVSSWHCTILDRIPNNIIGEIWTNIDKELQDLFPVPTIIMADFRWGTWHGNWTNNVTLGVENRNSGFSGYRKLKHGLEDLNKEGTKIGKKTWETFTREQIVSNINFGRLANSLINGKLDPDWILTHQCVWSSKYDCGPLFPIHSLRRAIFEKTNENPLDSLSWLSQFPPYPKTFYDLDKTENFCKLPRNEPESNFVKWISPKKRVKQIIDNGKIASKLYQLGFHSIQLSTSEPHSDLNKFVRWYQRSTGALKGDRILKCDGIVGPKTLESLNKRIKSIFG